MYVKGTVDRKTASLTSALALHCSIYFGISAHFGKRHSKIASSKMRSRRAEGPYMTCMCRYLHILCVGYSYAAKCNSL